MAESVECRSQVVRAPVDATEGRTRLKKNFFWRNFFATFSTDQKSASNSAFFVTISKLVEHFFGGCTNSFYLIKHNF